MRQHTHLDPHKHVQDWSEGRSRSRYKSRRRSDVLLVAARACVQVLMPSQRLFPTLCPFPGRGTPRKLPLPPMLLLLPQPPPLLVVVVQEVTRVAPRLRD